MTDSIREYWTTIEQENTDHEADLVARREAAERYSAEWAQLDRQVAETIQARVKASRVLVAINPTRIPRPAGVDVMPPAYDRMVIVLVRRSDARFLFISHFSDYILGDDVQQYYSLPYGERSSVAGADSREDAARILSNTVALTVEDATELGTQHIRIAGAEREVTCVYVNKIRENFSDTSIVGDASKLHTTVAWVSAENILTE